MYKQCTQNLEVEGVAYINGFGFSLLISIWFVLGLSVTSKNTILCDNVQCDKKCNLLVQCNMKMVQCDSML